ncbi:MAG: fatty acid--CoA ligase [Nocardia sp.]|nr:fatty acid--CoA ligase [Nocardia sp.]
MQHLVRALSNDREVDTESPCADTNPEYTRGDLRWRNIGELLTDAANRLGNAEAVIDGNVRLSYADLDTLVWRIARSFLGIGVERGDRVAIWAPNSWQWVATALGLQRAGGVLVPLDARFSASEASYVLQKSKARLLCMAGRSPGHDYPQLLRTAVGTVTKDRPYALLPHLECVVTFDGETRRGMRTWNEFLTTGTTIDSETAHRLAAEIDPEDLSDILFTAGTTGRPKGVMCTHQQALRAYTAWTAAVGLRGGDRYLILSPFSNGFGYKAGWLACFIAGATVLPARSLDGTEVLRVVRQERVSVITGTATLFQPILKHPDFTAASVASLRLAVFSATCVPPTLLQGIKEGLGLSHIVTSYGLTESCAIVSTSRCHDPLDTVATTSGRPLPGLSVIAVDTTGRSVPAGTRGEILVRGYTVMKGYFGQDARTETTIDTDGWLHTGDIGVIDEDGRLRITDRITDMYTVNGCNAYPTEIEEILDHNPNIAQTAVIGVPDEQLGEVGAAFVVPRRGAQLDENELIAWARRNMANHKVPQYVFVCDKLPTNAAGKVVKGVLRERARRLGNSDRPL